jgi:hypothetical protein
MYNVQSFSHLTVGGINRGLAEADSVKDRLIRRHDPTIARTSKLSAWEKMEPVIEVRVTKSRAENRGLNHKFYKGERMTKALNAIAKTVVSDWMLRLNDTMKHVSVTLSKDGGFQFKLDKQLKSSIKDVVSAHLKVPDTVSDQEKDQVVDKLTSRLTHLATLKFLEAKIPKRQAVDPESQPKVDVLRAVQRVLDKTREWENKPDATSKEALALAKENLQDVVALVLMTEADSVPYAQHAPVRSVSTQGKQASRQSGVSSWLSGLGRVAEKVGVVALALSSVGAAVAKVSESGWTSVSLGEVKSDDAHGESYADIISQVSHAEDSGPRRLNEFPWNSVSLEDASVTGSVRLDGTSISGDASYAFDTHSVRVPIGDVMPGSTIMVGMTPSSEFGTDVNVGVGLSGGNQQTRLAMSPESYHFKVDRSARWELVVGDGDVTIYGPRVFNVIDPINGAFRAHGSLDLGAKQELVLDFEPATPALIKLEQDDDVNYNPLFKDVSILMKTPKRDLGYPAFEIVREDLCHNVASKSGLVECTQDGMFIQNGAATFAFPDTDLLTSSIGTTGNMEYLLYHSDAPDRRVDIQRGSDDYLRLCVVEGGAPLGCMTSLESDFEHDSPFHGKVFDLAVMSRDGNRGLLSVFGEFNNAFKPMLPTAKCASAAFSFGDWSKMMFNRLTVRAGELDTVLLHQVYTNANSSWVSMNPPCDSRDMDVALLSPLPDPFDPDSTGTSDTSGIKEMPDTSGSIGTSDTSGSIGTSDTSGSTGTSDTSGSTGTSDTSGSIGTSDTSGSIGTSDTSGSIGTSDTSGSIGTSDTSGSTGTSDTSGSTETSDTSGSTGTSDTSGSTETSDTSGSTATSDTSGSTGTSGSGDSLTTVGVVVSLLGVALYTGVKFMGQQTRSTWVQLFSSVQNSDAADAETVETV